MATTQVHKDYILAAIDNLEKHIAYIKPIKEAGYEHREKEYNDKRKWISWLVDNYEDSWQGIDDYCNYYYYGKDWLRKAEKLSMVVLKSEDGKIMLDGDEVGMLESFLNLKTG